MEILESESFEKLMQVLCSICIQVQAVQPSTYQHCLTIQLKPRSRKFKQWRKFYSENAPKVCVYGVAASPDDFVFGLVVFVFNEQYAEIHFGISDQFSNRGIATELCRSGLQYLKSLGVNEVRTNPFIEHIASIRVLEKSGFSNHGTLKNHARFPTLGNGLFNCADMRLSL